VSALSLSKVHTVTDVSALSSVPILTLGTSYLRKPVKKLYKKNNNLYIGRRE
jgi:hypothetical protein